MRLREYNTNIVKWYIDASHAIHNYIIGHTEVTLQTVKGITISKYIKHKLNTKISIESELVGIYNGMADVLWKKIEGTRICS